MSILIDLLIVSTIMLIIISTIVFVIMMIMVRRRIAIGDFAIMLLCLDQYPTESPVAIIAGSFVAIFVCLVIGLIMMTVFIKR